tara:strand:- start:1594 stop:5631 length:4038 start_codon:yes stop_codon:yes gene_type:complete
MKSKNLVLFIILIIATFGSLYSQNNNQLISFIDEKTPIKQEQPKRTVISSEKSVSVTYEISNGLVIEKKVKGETYKFLNIKDFDYTDQVGFPSIPSHIDIVALPYQAKPKIIIESADFIEYSGFYLHPTLALASDHIGASEPLFEKNELQYNKNEFYPSKLVELVELQKIRETPLAFTEIHPVQFNPVTKKIRVYSKITYRIDFEGAKAKFSEISKNTNQSTLNIINNISINNKSLPKIIHQDSKSAAKTVANFDYIIVTHPDYIMASKELAKWKMQLGFKVEIISSSSWNSNNIKDSLHTKYNNYATKPSYVLFMGDVDKVPGELINNQFITDLYYVCMDGVGDYVADMARGRIAVTSQADAMIAVNKIINYEKNPVADPTFYSTGLNCAEFQDSDDNGFADRRFSLTSENIFDHLTTNYNFNIDRVYGSGSTNPTNWNNGSYAAGEPVPSYLLKPGFLWDGSGTDVQSMMNLGQLYVLHRDHGYSEGWGVPDFNTSYIPSLTNGNRLPVMFSINCSSGDLDHPGSFAKKLLTHPNGGAVGVIAASDISYSGLNDAFTLGLFDAIWNNPGLIPNFTGSGGTGNTPPAHSTILSLGDVLNQGLLTMAATWNNNERTNQLFHYHGDPSMKIWTAIPTQITATTPIQIQCGDSSVVITNSSCLDGLATVYFNNQLIGSQQLVNGNGLITFPSITNINPSITVTVSKENHHPFVVDIPINNCTISPEAIFEASTDNEVLCGGTTKAIIFTDLSNFSPTDWEWSFTPNTITYVNLSNKFSQHPEIVFNNAGTYTVKQIVTNTYGSDSITLTNLIEISEGITLPLFENFEDGVFPPKDWTINNPDSSKTWESYTGSIGNGLSNQASRLNFYNYSNQGELDELISPKLDFSNTTNPMLEFKISHIQYSTFSDQLKVLISTDCGSTFQTIYDESGSNLVTSSNSTNNSWTPNTANDWRQETIDLSNYQGNTVIVKFQSVTGYGNNLYLDDINFFSGDLLPETDFIASETELYCQPAVTYLTDISQYNAGNHQWTFSPNSVTFMNGTNANSVNPEVILNVAGSYQVSLSTSNPNGNDTETKTAYIQLLGGHVLPLTEGFELSTGIPSEWTIENPDNKKTWTWNNSSSGNGTSTASIFMDFWRYSNTGERDAIISKIIDLTAPGNAQLSFNVAYAQYSINKDSLLVSISTDCGNTFNSPVYIKGGIDLITTTSSGEFTPSNTNDWRGELIDLNNYIGNKIKIKFEAITDYGNNLYIDDINIYYNSITNVIENKEYLTIEAIPNPTNGVVKLTVKGIIHNDLHYELTNITGEIIINKTAINSEITEINLDNYPSGIYLIKLADHLSNKVLKIIKQ